MLKLLPAALVVFASAACSGGPSTAPLRTDADSGGSPQPAVITPVAVDNRLHSSSHSAYGEPAQLVLTTPQAWSGVWSTLHGGISAAAPPVNFATHVVVLVATGPRNTGGHAVRVEGTAAEADGGVTVHVVRTAPGAGCMTTQEVTSPVDVVRLPRPAGAVRFSVRDVERPC